MSDDALEQHDPPRRAWRWPFGWVGLLALAWVVFELTHSPSIASVLICLKFGWEDFLTARWLSKSDPDGKRGNCLFYLHLAWGLWKSAIVAFFMSLAFAVVTPRNQQALAVPQALPAFFTTFLTTLLCFWLSALLTLATVFDAWRGGYRLWLDSAAHRARRFDFWPPTPFCVGRPNRLGQLLMSSLGLAAFLLVLLTVTLAWPGPGGAVLGFVLSITAPVAIVLAREFLTSRVWAESPEECWPEEWDDANA